MSKPRYIGGPLDRKLVQAEPPIRRFYKHPRLKPFSEDPLAHCDDRVKIYTYEKCHIRRENGSVHEVWIGKDWFKQKGIQ